MLQSPPHFENSPTLADKGSKIEVVEEVSGRGGWM